MVLMAVMVQFVIVLSGIGMDINVGSMVSLPIALVLMAMVLIPSVYSYLIYRKKLKGI